MSEVASNQELKTLKSSLLLSRSLEQTFSVIEALDLELVLAKLCASSSSKDAGYNWPKQEAQQALKAYRGYLKLAAEWWRRVISEGVMKPEGLAIQSPDKQVPRLAVDIVWHTHILFTRKYFKDCQQVFGFYLHHTPTIGERA